jgi:hypothetical protein
MGTKLWWKAMKITNCKLCLRVLKTPLKKNRRVDVV